MEIEFKGGDILSVRKVLTVLVNVVFVLGESGDYWLINRRAIVGRYGIDE